LQSLAAARTTGGIAIFDAKFRFGFCFRIGPGFLNLDFALCVARADFRRERVTAQERVNRGGDIHVDGKAVALLDFDQYIKSGRGTSLEHRFLGAAPACFLIR
jgi:hypothetical protein